MPNPESEEHTLQVISRPLLVATAELLGPEDALTHKERVQHVRLVYAVRFPQTKA